MITVPYRKEGREGGVADVLCSLAPWTDLPICETAAHTWTFQAEEALSVLWNSPGACKGNEKVLGLREETLLLNSVSEPIYIYVKAKFILLQMGTETELRNT